MAETLLLPRHELGPFLCRGYPDRRIEAIRKFARSIPGLRRVLHIPVYLVRRFVVRARLVVRVIQALSVTCANVMRHKLLPPYVTNTRFTAGQ